MEKRNSRLVATRLPPWAYDELEHLVERNGTNMAEFCRKEILRGIKEATFAREIREALGLGSELTFVEAIRNLRRRKII